VKAVNDLFSPISGKIIEINVEVVDNPGVINDDPYRSGWLIKVEITGLSQLDKLMDSEAYKSMLE
jgi:glycine cleavage system H protein